MIQDEIMTMSVAQLRAARGLLGWSQADLGRAAGVGTSTIADWESGKKGRRLHPRTEAALREALEAAGVVFTERGVEDRR